MIRFSAQARKYVVAIVGIAGLIALRHFQIEIPGVPDLVRDAIAGVLVAEGVYQAKNA